MGSPTLLFTGVHLPGPHVSGLQHSLCLFCTLEVRLSPANLPLLRRATDFSSRYRALVEPLLCVSLPVGRWVYRHE